MTAVPNPEPAVSYKTVHRDGQKTSPEASWEVRISAGSLMAAFNVLSPKTPGQWTSQSLWFLQLEDLYGAFRTCLWDSQWLSHISAVLCEKPSPNHHTSNSLSVCSAQTWNSLLSLFFPFASLPPILCSLLLPFKFSFFFSDPFGHGERLKRGTLCHSNEQSGAGRVRVPGYCPFDPNCSLTLLDLEK